MRPNTIIWVLTTSLSREALMTSLREFTGEWQWFNSVRLNLQLKSQAWCWFCNPEYPLLWEHFSKWKGTRKIRLKPRHIILEQCKCLGFLFDSLLFWFVVCFGGMFYLPFCFLFVVWGGWSFLLFDVSSQNGDRQYLARIEPILIHYISF